MSDRRTFLGQLGVSAAALLWTDRILAGSVRPSGAVSSVFRPVHIGGKVTSEGRPVAGVSVTDGLSVVRTDRDGSYAMISSSLRPFVSISLPAGYSIPRNPQGPACFYHPVRDDGGDRMTAVFELRRLEQSDDEHAFVLMADPQVQDADDVSLLHREAVPDIRETARSLEPRHLFGVACGDIMYDRLDLIPEYERAVRAVGIPCFQVPGNHDVNVEALTDATSCETFQRHFGPTYYSFDRGRIHYVVLDDVFWFGGYMGYLDQRQLDWLANDLSFVRPGRTVVVFVHIPTFTLQHLRDGKSIPSQHVIVANRQLLYRLLEPYRSYVICGHMHQSEYFPEMGAEIHICGAVCGAWWTGPVCPDGTPKGYSVYEACGENLSWRYKSLGKPNGHQMRLYPPGADAARPDDMIANIWSADERWTIDWYENGVKRGNMVRGIGMDPLSVELYRGKGRPGKRNWVEPANTDHLFFARPSEDANEITVEATDPWGRIYTERLSL